MNRRQILEHVAKLVSEDRNETHGDPHVQFPIAQLLKSVCRSGRQWEHLDPVLKENIEIICTKLSRIVEGNPFHRDHYDDIAGYAGIAAGFVDSKKPEKKRRRK